eukprot:CAMPEP_0182452078 /NCGR_PEP_ID=MMETSP1172-20130603/44060_1 /TAXON_ID=708627 /ORGANISM="Timspurckia oligopyrenoides, Strain CCMP3278" /LENGTH=547 /DNA_ID=CAMNT_0024649895 /DNA_START=1551 /DNA_END=3194 /DNA_ORIENTATION=+
MGKSGKKRDRDDVGGADENEDARVKRKERKVEKKLKKLEKKKSKEKLEKQSTGENVMTNSALHGAESLGYTLKEITEYRLKYNIIVEPDSAASVFPPYKSFSESKLPSKILSVTKSFSSPTPVQSQALPIALAGLDLVAIARTGSGKTLAFGLPALNYITKQIANESKASVSNVVTPLVLVLSPTRELAIQISDVLREAATECKIGVSVVYGGTGKQQQYRDALKVNCRLLIATPGRLLDMMNDGSVSLHECGFAVLDEADRMLDLGFEREVRAIMDAVRPNGRNARQSSKSSKVKAAPHRQTLMFSATWPNSVRQLAENYLRDSPNTIKVSVGGSGERATASLQITQVVEVMQESQKEEKLSLLLREHGRKGSRVIVFALYKKEAARVERNIGNRLSGIIKGVVSIHGDKPQREREEALNAFVQAKANILVATDVAARGLDIPDVDCVINYTFPLTIEDYVHRIGRTGRGSKSGKSFTFFTDENKAHAGSLVNVLREANQDVPDEIVQRFALTTKKKEHSLYGAFARDDIAGSATKITFSQDSDDE